MFSDQDCGCSFTTGSLTQIGECFVILLLVFIPTGAAGKFLREQGMSKPSQELQPTEPEVIARVIVGPGRSLRVNDVPTTPDDLIEAIGQPPADGAVVELQTLTPVDYALNYDTRFTLRAKGFSLHELSPRSRTEGPE